MSKRFGRNQRRKLRAALDVAHRGLAEHRDAAQHWYEVAVARERDYNELADRLRRFCEVTHLLPPKRVQLSPGEYAPGALRVYGAPMLGAEPRVEVLPVGHLMMALRSHPEAMQHCVHAVYRGAKDTGVTYAISDKALRSMTTQDLSEYLAPLIAEIIATALVKVSR